MSLLKQIGDWGNKVGHFNYVYRMMTRQFTKRVLHRPSHFKLKNGFTLRLPVWSGFSGVVWVTKGEADDGCEQVMEIFSERGGAFLDVGAHFGYWAASMSHLSKNVIAVEPNPLCQSELAHNLRTFSSTIVAQAVSDQTGELEFLADASAPHSALVDSKTDRTRAGNYILVPVTTIDSIWSQSGGANIWGVKIDTEGHEAKVILGSREMLRACRPVLLMEASAYSLAIMLPLLSELEYSFGWLSERAFKKRQTLRIVDGQTALADFKEGMLFAIPNTKLNQPRLIELSAIINVLKELS